jgi:broad specificity phosphatase PhoE
MMPLDLVLVRHGDSEGNAFKRLQQNGEDVRDFNEVFKDRHSSSFRLTDLGIRQAEKAGEWIRENLLGGRFDRCYTSSYLRAMETASLLRLLDTKWYMEPCLRERGWGDLDLMSEAERRKYFAASLRMKKVTPLYWIPPNGESIMHACETRVYRMLGTLARECAGKRVIIVAHGEIMWCFRLLLERIPEHVYNELDASTDMADRIFNCQIIHYTRRNPETFAIDPYYRCMRMIRPGHEGSDFNSDWRSINRPAFTNDQLGELVSRQARVISAG